MVIVNIYSHHENFWAFTRPRIDFGLILLYQTYEFHWSYLSFISQCPRTDMFRGVCIYQDIYIYIYIWASYWVLIVRIFNEINCVVTALYQTAVDSILYTNFNRLNEAPGFLKWNTRHQQCNFNPCQCFTCIVMVFLSLSIHLDISLGNHAGSTIQLTQCVNCGPLGGGVLFPRRHTLEGDDLQQGLCSHLIFHWKMIKSCSALSDPFYPFLLRTKTMLYLLMPWAIYDKDSYHKIFQRLNDAKPAVINTMLVSILTCVLIAVLWKYLPNFSMIAKQNIDLATWDSVKSYEKMIESSPWSLTEWNHIQV